MCAELQKLVTNVDHGLVMVMVQEVSLGVYLLLLLRQRSLRIYRLTLILDYS